MKTYPAEESIASIIQQSNSIAYTSELSAPSESESKIIAGNLENVAQANISDMDLFYHKSILVSTVWNKNDDVFSPLAVWEAKSTPLHKPTNLEHNSTKIVGHMNSCWAVNEDQELIADDTDAADLPDKYHLLVGAVVYRLSRDKDQQEVINTLIDEISEGKQKVSMECLFTDFDYALSNGKDNHIVKREEATAFLSKHLRAYGGRGMYDGYKVGRILKNITFSGKAYTKTPANPDSLIFTDTNEFDFANASYLNNFEKKSNNSTLFKNSGVNYDSTTFNDGVFTMANAANTNDAQVDLLTKENASLASKVEDLQKQIAEANTEKIKADLAEAQEQLAQANKKVEDCEGELAEANKKYEDTQKSFDEAKANFDKVFEEKEALAKELDTIKSEAAKASRVEQLVKAGLDNKEAEAFADKFSDLEDERFTLIAEMHSKMYGDKKKDEKKEEKKVEKPVPSKAEVETAEVDETVASEVVDENEDDGSELISSVAAILANKTKTDNDGDK